MTRTRTGPRRRGRAGSGVDGRRPHGAGGPPRRGRPVVRRDGRDVGRFGAVLAARVRRQRRRAAHAPDGGVAHLRQAGRLRVELRREHGWRPTARSAGGVRVDGVAAQADSRAAPAAADGRARGTPARGPRPAGQCRRAGAPRRRGRLGRALGAHPRGARLRPRGARAVRTGRCAGGRGSRGGHGLVRHPRLVPAGDHQRAALHRRRHLVVDQHRPHGRPRPRRGPRPRTSGVVRPRRPP